MASFARSKSIRRNKSRKVPIKRHTSTFLPFQLRPPALLSTKKGAPPDRALPRATTPRQHTQCGTTPPVGCVQHLYAMLSLVLTDEGGSLESKRSILYAKLNQLCGYRFMPLHRHSPYKIAARFYIARLRRLKKEISYQILSTS